MCSISVRNDGGSEVGTTSGDNSFKEMGKIIVIFHALINDYITINFLVWLADGNNNYNSYWHGVSHATNHFLHLLSFFFNSNWASLENHKKGKTYALLKTD